MLREYTLLDLDRYLSPRKRRRARLRRMTLGMWGTPPTPYAGTPPYPAPGLQMPDGFSAKIVFTLYPTCPFWEVEPKFGGIDGGAPIKLSTMRNVLWHTAAPRTLLMAEDTEVEVSYQPDLIDKVINHLINKNGVVTEFFPDGTTFCYYGWLGKLGAMSMQEGSMPKSSITIHRSNRDAAGLEAGPVLTPAVGT
jgi:hypothetical protein